MIVFAEAEPRVNRVGKDCLQRYQKSRPNGDAPRSWQLRVQPPLSIQLLENVGPVTRLRGSGRREYFAARALDVA